MVCPSIRTGESFLAATLEHIDCQARTIGSFGYGALADPLSPVSLALTGLLTIFVALFGIRLLLGYPMAGRDLVMDFLKLAIVLTLATSWPAWRVVGYDLIVEGPAEIAKTIGLASGLPGSAGDMASRLQRVDEALAALNIFGTGRLGVAQGDWFQLGFARIAWLAGTLGPLALIRLMAGILLAIAPLVAGLLLFGISRPVFAGWVRGLAMTFLASVALTVLLGVQLALLEPWLQDALQQRAADLQTLDAPVEILALTVSFALIAIGAMVVSARIAFHPEFVGRAIPVLSGEPRDRDIPSEQPQRSNVADRRGASQAQNIAYTISEGFRREERISAFIAGSPTSSPAASGASAVAGAAHVDIQPALGDSYRRNTRRVSASAKQRDKPQ